MFFRPHKTDAFVILITLEQVSQKLLKDSHFKSVLSLIMKLCDTVKVHWGKYI